MQQTLDFSNVPSSVRQFGIYLDGEMKPSQSGKFTVRYSPAHDCPVTEIACAGIDDVDLAVASARKSSKSCSINPRTAKRNRLLGNIGDWQTDFAN